MNIYYLGPTGSYSSIVAESAFPDSEFVAKSSFQKILDHVLNDSNGIGVLPLENSSTNDIHENVDYLFKHNLQIIGEANLLIRLHLVGSKDAKTSDIRRAFSHPKALLQCSEYLKAHSIEGIPVSSTAAGKDEILKNCLPEEAAIGSLLLAKNKDLCILDKNIGNVRNNKTRFIFISQTNLLEEQNSQTKERKLTLTFKAKHEPGSLAKVLSAIAESGCNLTKIESRPIPESEWEYRFWVDLQLTENRVDALLEIIKTHTLEHRMCGIYPPGPIYES